MDLARPRARPAPLRHRPARAARARADRARSAARSGSGSSPSGSTYAAESLAHGLLPGLVLAALAGAPLLLGAAGGALVAAVLIALAARDERDRPGHGHGRGGHRAGRPRRPARARARLSPAARGAAVRRPARRDRRRPRRSGAPARAAAAPRWRRSTARCRRRVRPRRRRRGGRAPGARPARAARLLAVAIAVAVQGLGALLVLAVLVAPPVAVRGHARTPARAMVGGRRGGGRSRRLVGIELSFHARQRGGRLGGARALRARPRSAPALRPSPGAARRGAPTTIAAPSRQQHQADELRLREARHHRSSFRRMNSTRKRSTPASIR